MNDVNICLTKNVYFRIQPHVETARFRFSRQKNGEKFGNNDTCVGRQRSLGVKLHMKINFKEI